MISKIYDVIIIGAGPSACYLAMNLDDNLHTLVIDKNNQILKKFLLSGNGKANITNICDHETFLKNMIFGTKNFMYHAFKTHSSTEIVNFLKANNLEYKQRENTTKIHLLVNNPVYVSIIQQHLDKKPNLDLLLKTTVVSIKKENDLFQVASTNGIFNAKNIVVATGGLSFSKFSGCTGDGYRFAKSFNIPVNKTFAMGISLALSEQLKQFTGLSGTSFGNVKAKLFLNKKLLVDENGDMMITHNGIGGPIIRRVSGYISYYENEGLDLYLDLIQPSELNEVLNKIKRLHEMWDYFPQFTKKFIKNFYDNLNLDSLTDVTNLNKSIKKQIVDYFINIHVDNIVKKFDVEQAISTGGGINTKHINPKTFMSNEIDGLYFIGEVLDVNAKTGGFNLTLCYSSALCCADDLNKKTS